MKRLLMLAVAAAALVVMACPAFATIAGSPHDYLATSVHGRCGVCHVPHAALGAKRLWRVTVPGGGTSWHGSNVGQLCATCHASDGTIATANVNTDAPHQRDVIFAATSHGRTVATLATVGGANAARPYMTTASMECTSCHNVHFDGTFASASDNRPFLRPAAVQATMSEFCADCHDDRYNNNTLGNANTALQHPVRIAYTGVNATLVAVGSMPAGLKVAVALNTWSLGGKFEGNLTGAPTGASLIGCQTCHAVHNPAAGTDQALHLLAVNNVAATAALCEGCHGDPAGNAARTQSGATMMVGSAIGDHPIDCAIAAPGPAIDLWYNSALSTVRAERNTANGGAAGGDWPRGTGTNIVCTSCHSAHNTLGLILGVGQKLRRTGSAATTWCGSCHSDASPLGHHSHAGNWGSSGLDCADCHGGAGGSAHNGFSFNSNFANVTNNDKSQLCNYCHIASTISPYGSNDSDPIFALPIPAGHLSAVVNATLQSHYLGTFTDNANGINVKTGNWGDGTHPMYSKYGGSETHGAATDATGTEMICESCHSVTHNIGASAYVIVPGAATGYNNNLLLQDYRDDTSAGSAVQSEFCVACHNQNINVNGMGTADGPTAWATTNVKATVPAGTHPMTNWTISKAVDANRGTTTLITGGLTYANAAGAPNSAQYYAADSMDCDSCHRPHNAPSHSVYNQTAAGGAGNSRPVILEVQAADNEWADLCQECHTEGM